MAMRPMTRACWRFVANLRKIGEDKALQAVYRKFLAAPGSRLGFAKDPLDVEDLVWLGGIDER